MDIAKLREHAVNIERIAKIGQDVARESMDKAPSQRGQNSNFRFVLQEVGDIIKMVEAEMDK